MTQTVDVRFLYGSKYLKHYRFYADDTIDIGDIIAFKEKKYHCRFAEVVKIISHPTRIPEKTITIEQVVGTTGFKTKMSKKNRQEFIHSEQMTQIKNNWRQIENNL